MKSEFSAYDQVLGQLWQDHQDQPANAAFLHAVCYALNVRARHNKCAELARMGLAQHPNDPNLYFELLIATSLTSNGDLTELGLALENLVDQRPGDLGCIRNFALYNFYMENDADAARLLNEIIEEFDPDQLDQSTFEVLAQLEYAYQHYESCMAYCDRALAKPGPAARTVRLKGLCHLDLGQLEEARASFEQALDLEPYFVWACHSLGELHFEREDYARAFAFFGRAASINPGDPNHYFLLAESFMSKGANRMAIAELEKLLWCDPAIPVRAEAHNGLGYLMIQTGDLSAARNHLEKAVQLTPDMAAAHFHLSLLARAEASPEQEESHLQQALTLDSEHLEALLALGSLQMEQADLDAAESCFETILDIDPEFAPAYSGLCQLAKRRGLKVNQLMYARTAAQLDSEDIDLVIQLHQALQANGHQEEAVSSLADSLRRHPEWLGLIPLLRTCLNGPLLVQTGTAAKAREQATRIWAGLIQQAEIGSEFAQNAARGLAELDPAHPILKSMVIPNDETPTIA